MDELNNLIERIEKAEAGSFELDAAIARANGWKMEIRARSLWTKPGGIAARGGLPRFSTSIDAAMTLVPEGMHARIFCEGAQAIIVDFNETESGWWEVSRSALCPTPALALCAAALRARKEAQ